MIRRCLTLSGMALLLPVASMAAESVMLGRGFSSVFRSDLSCTDETGCMEPIYIWEFNTRRTLAGPSMSGRVRAVVRQPTRVTRRYVRSIRIFVLKPIEDAALRAAYGVDYRVVTMSPLHEGDEFCLMIDPRSVGLNVQSARDDRGFHCFSAKGL